MPHRHMCVYVYVVCVCVCVVLCVCTHMLCMYVCVCVQADMKKHIHFHPVSIVYRNVNFYTMVPEKRITTVGSTLLSMLCGPGPKHRVDIVKNITGRIQRGKVTLVMGPPGA
jgi:hypothetical protein